MTASLDQIISCLRFIAEHLLNGLILSAAIFVGAVLASRWFFREQHWNPVTRYQVSLFLFLALASTPILTIFKPISSRDGPRAEVSVLALAATEELVPPARPPEDVSPSSRVITPTNDTESKDHFPEPTIWLRWVDWPLVIGALWAISVAVYLIRLALAIDRLLVLHYSAIPVHVAPGPAVRRKIVIAESSLISSPVAVGLWSPKILLPPNFQSRFSSQDQQNVLRHEIAHLERFDDWSNLIQQLCIALFPINPFLLILRGRLRLLEEIACDDWAVVGVDQPKNYANLLTRLATSRGTGSLLVSGVSRRGQQLYQRISRILDKNCNRSLKPSWRTTVLAGLAVLCASAIGLIWIPAVKVSAQTVGGPVGDHKPAPLSSEVIALLKNSALNDADPGVRREAVNALSNTSGDEATSALLALLNDSKDEQVKLLVLRRLNRERVDDARVREKLNDLASKEQSLPIRIGALNALARNIDDGVVEKLISIYRSASEGPIKETCLRGLSLTSSKTAKDFLMSVAKDDPDSVMRRVAVRAISGPMGRRILVRVGGPNRDRIFFKSRNALIGAQELDDLEYPPFGNFPDGAEIMALPSQTDPFDLPDDPAELEADGVEPLAQRLEQLNERIHTIHLPELIGGESVTVGVPPAPLESPSTKPNASPSP
ncbi:MAG TPA: M56 family metallopeptidase [Chthoniobacterales bacterium]|nr:M56 family metallopeptidase [Chthoniobacterales bacterium]